MTFLMFCRFNLPMASLHHAGPQHVTKASTGQRPLAFHCLPLCIGTYVSTIKTPLKRKAREGLATYANRPHLRGQ